MTKREVVKLLAEVLNGTTNHQYLGIDYKNKKWYVFLEMNRTSNQYNFQHDRNDCTQKEAKEILENAMRGY